MYLFAKQATRFLRQGVGWVMAGVALSGVGLSTSSQAQDTTIGLASLRGFRFTDYNELLQHEEAVTAATANFEAVFPVGSPVRDLMTELDTNLNAFCLGNHPEAVAMPGVNAVAQLATAADELPQVQERIQQRWEARGRHILCFVDFIGSREYGITFIRWTQNIQFDERGDIESVALSRSFLPYP